MLASSVCSGLGFKRSLIRTRCFSRTYIEPAESPAAMRSAFSTNSPATSRNSLRYWARSFVTVRVRTSLLVSLDFPKVLKREPMKPSPAPISAPINPKMAFSMRSPLWPNVRVQRMAKKRSFLTVRWNDLLGVTLLC